MMKLITNPKTSPHSNIDSFDKQQLKDQFFFFKPLKTKNNYAEIKSTQGERIVYKPFEYPKAHEYWLKQQQAHWIHTEVPMMSDINDWKAKSK